MFFAIRYFVAVGSIASKNIKMGCLAVLFPLLLKKNFQNEPDSRFVKWRILLLARAAANKGVEEEEEEEKEGQEQQEEGPRSCWLLLLLLPVLAGGSS